MPLVVSPEENGDYLQFLVDDDVKYEISGEVPWQKKTYTITNSGSHTLKWRYIKDSSADGGDDRAWVDFVQWTQASPVQDPNNWSNITYKYDPSGRRIEKSCRAGPAPPNSLRRGRRVYPRVLLTWPITGGRIRRQ